MKTIWDQTMSALATDTGGYYDDDIMTQKSTRRKSKKHKKGGVDFTARTGRGGGVEHYREYSPTPMHNMPDFMMNPFDRPTSEQVGRQSALTIDSLRSHLVLRAKVSKFWINKQLIFDSTIRRMFWKTKWHKNAKNVQMLL